MSRTKAKPKWIVEHRFTYGWDDAGWSTTDPKTNKDVPVTFDSKKEADASIAELIADTKEAGLDGYRRKDYRAVSLSREEFERFLEKRRHENRN